MSAAYGSAVFPQSTKKESGGMVDLMFAVCDSTQWHRENMARHGHHYSSFARVAGPATVTRIQKTACGVYFNAYAQLKPPQEPPITVKYGVIEYDSLFNDLTQWTHLYTSGRLQKPCLIHHCDPDLQEALHRNLCTAVTAAFLQLPPQFTTQSLYRTIAGLSYMGDIRMGIAENPHKISNIVKHNMTVFDEWYSDVLLEMQSRGFCTLKTNAIEQNTSRHSELVALLPSAVQVYLNQGKTVHEAVTLLVRRDSLKQTLKGVFTAGVFNSARYAVRKLYKTIQAPQ